MRFERTASSLGGKRSVLLSYEDVERSSTPLSMPGAGIEPATSLTFRKELLPLSYPGWSRV